ncbi:microtubule-associated tumor suppressor 1 homolog isoform X5 [Fundulus heteroclitus]|uniref:microtubule-associated tumor suppressor 1 homolog isoform X5 n=1 Tax=Fundulus heteroclitus TaxID=8078 RepID=UPI00165BCE0C|nr:microtubule-associated tumor suppressor 1 homolog isoform X5 [Fundulus heteroclitus]
MSVLKPPENFSVRKTSSCGMKLPLHRSGDHNGNAFPVSSSSSSASSCLGESSPESLRSLSSLSGGGTDSPLEDDVLEVRLVTAVVPGTDSGDVVLSTWPPQEEEEEEEEEDSSAGRFPADVSVSVYLDAISGDHHQDTWSDSLSLNADHGRRYQDVTSVDSDTTEIPDDEDDDEEEEAVFVSVSSDVCVTLAQVSPGESGPGGGLLKDGTASSTGPEDAPAAQTSRLEAKNVHRTAARTGPQNASPSKTAPQQKKPAAPRRAADGGRRTPAGPVKVAVVLRPSGGRRAGAKAHHKVAPPSTWAQPALTCPVGPQVVRDPEAPGTEVQVLLDAADRRGPSAPREKELMSPEPVAEPAEEKRGAASKRLSSRPGPGARQEARPARTERRPAPPTGSEPRPPAGQNQNQGIPKPRASAIAHSPTASVPKPTSNQQPASGSAGRQPTPPASKLPVKGVAASLSCSSLGSNENNAANGKASPGAPSPTGSRPDESTRRGAPPSGSQSPTEPPASGISGPAHCSSAAAAGGRSRAPVLQARTSTPGLKVRVGTNQNQNGTRAPAGQPLARPTPTRLQRSGSARPGRLNGSVDKNKRPAGTGSQQNQQNQQNQPLPAPEPVPDVLNANSPAEPALPVQSPDGSSPTSGYTGPTGPGHKARTGSRTSPKHGPRLQHPTRPGPAAPAGTVKQNQNKEQAEKRNQAVVQLRRLLVQGNRKVEALAAVIQHLFSEREETVKQRKELSAELARLREELAASSQCCQSLQAEKEEARANLEEALKRTEEQHQEELVELENRLKSFYQEEWDKVHLLYQEEADRCRLLMEQQVEELRRQQEAERRRQEEAHSQTMEAVRQEYEASVRELKRNQQTDLEVLQRTLSETQTSLTEKISALSAENQDLSEKLRAEEERRQRILSDRTAKDSHTLYLEQELESLKVVLEIKNNQLHQKDKKLMEMDKLVETNVRLEEVLKKVQQENEDYKARMDKHAALSRQLSTEQALLQQTLQKESKVNKRLSMENEELLWKLHNGDLLGSPRRPSPTSPYSSPRNSASFPPTAPPLSPR